MESKIERNGKKTITCGRDLDMGDSKQRVWLVKVPKYISSRWEKIQGTEVAGTVQITKLPGKKMQTKLMLSNEVMKIAEEDVPKEHVLLISDGSASQALGVLAQVSTPPTRSSPLVADKLCFQGKVVYKVDCRPVANQSYMKLKRESMLRIMQPTKTVKQLDRVIQPHKTVLEHKSNIESKEGTKAEGKKIREDKSRVMDMLFAAFEQHQYYNIRALVNITKQPVNYLKEILKEVCVYNLKNPHKNMWELKPEYHCYKK